MIALYHRTTRAAARAIVARGFRDFRGHYGVGKRSSGVWFSNRPIDCNEGVKGDTLIRVILRANKRDLARFEWVEPGKHFREWQIPAALVSARTISLRVVPPWCEHVV